MKNLTGAVGGLLLVVVHGTLAASRADDSHSCGVCALSALLECKGVNVGLEEIADRLPGVDSSFEQLAVVANSFGVRLVQRRIETVNDLPSAPFILHLARPDIGAGGHFVYVRQLAKSAGEYQVFDPPQVVEIVAGQDLLLKAGFSGDVLVEDREWLSPRSAGSCLIAAGVILLLITGASAYRRKSRRVPSTVNCPSRNRGISSDGGVS